MSSRELILLTPFRLPAQNALYLSNEDVACLLNGYLVLWHPAALRHAASPPRIGSPYDYEQPTAGHLYAVPEAPPLVLPDDWYERVRGEGALAVQVPEDRSATFANLREALRSQLTDAQDLALVDLDQARIAPFLGLGFGYAHLEALFEAMDHQPVLDTEAFWNEVQQAVAALFEPDPEAYRPPLQAAAERLLAAREVLYPSAIHLINLYLPTEKTLNEALPFALERGLAPVNVVASTALLEQLAQHHPERLALLKERLANELAEVCGGCYLEREDALLPLESQLWNLRHGKKHAEALLNHEIRVFGRRRFAFHPHTPAFLQTMGLSRALLLPFDEAVVPTHRSTSINWPSSDGKQVDALTRTPHATDNPQVFFHAAHHLHQTIMQDQTATLVLSTSHATGPWLEDWLELTRLAPVLGKFTTLSRYFDEVYSGEYTSPASADEFHGDYLTERTAPDETLPTGDTPDDVAAASPPPAPRVTAPYHSCPVSGFAHQVRARRQIDTAWSLAALHRSLAGKSDTLRLDGALAEAEDRLEREPVVPPSAALTTELERLVERSAEALREQLLARATASTPGYLVLNPCSFTRRTVLELPDFTHAPAAVGPVKASQLKEGIAQLVVEVPPLGFAWFPRNPGDAAGKEKPARMRLADERCVRNEFFEAEVDPTTGGLRGIRDQRTRINRLGQQLIFNPGSTSRVTQIRTTSTGPALGEIITEGELLDEQQEVLARFRQRFRAWLSRPVLDLRIEIFPVHNPVGYPWHSYYGARFAWRDERTILVRGVNGLPQITTQTRPETPDFLDLRLGPTSTTILPGGLPFHQRHGSRMLDLIMVTPGETATTFDLALMLDRDYPAQTALGLVTPVPVIPTRKGPPHVGASGWLFHLDVPNLLMSSFRPAPEGGDGVVARFMECADHSGSAELRCVRNPLRVQSLDGLGQALAELRMEEDTAHLDYLASELFQVQIDFS